MKTDTFISAIGGGALLGLGYLYLTKTNDDNRHHRLTNEASYRSKVPVSESFQVMNIDEMHPEQHPEQTTSAENVICLYQMAADLTYLFDLFGVSAWVSGATLLGAIRHGGLVPWDTELEFFAYSRDQAGLGQLFLSNTLRAYGYQAIPLQDESGWMFYMGSAPEVKAILYWVEPCNSEKTCPTGDLNRNSCDPDCGMSLKTLSKDLMKTPHHGYLGMVNEIEPRRKWAFGATNVYVPSQYDAILNRQEGEHWKVQGDDPSLAPPSDMSRVYQEMPWYRAPRVLCERDTKPATPIGPLKPVDRAITKYSRDVDIKGKYGI